MRFVKYESSGNDFILIEDNAFVPAKTQIERLCSRKFGIGADGVLLLGPSKTCDFKMRIFNADGREAAMCGNGICAIITHLQQDCTIETRGGTVAGTYNNSIENCIIKATLPKTEILRTEIALPSGLTGYLLDTGTPHLVIFTNDISTIDEDLGYQLRKHGNLPETNVNFAQHVNNKLLVRTFEKGVPEETLACGTGGAAVYLMHSTLANCQKPKIIQFKSQEKKEYSLTGGKLWMEGTAQRVFEGNCEFIYAN